jgi:hypothetical protein
MVIKKKISFIEIKEIQINNICVCKLYFRDVFGVKSFVTAKAKCYKDDLFDLKKGKAIAKARAEIKARNIFIRQLKKFLNYIHNFTDELDDQICKMNDHNQADENYIKKLSDDN